MNAVAAERSAPPRPPRRARRRRWPLLLGLLVVAGTWLAWCAFTIVRAHDDIQAGRALARIIQHEGYDGVVDGEARPQLDAALAHFTAAAERLKHPALAPLRILPVIGRQLDSTTSLATSVSDGLTAGNTALDRLDQTLDVALPSGPERPAALRDLARIASDLGAELRLLDLGPDEGLIGRLAEARAELQGDLDELIVATENTEVVAGGMAEVLDGPGRWLLLAANNAQMQNGSGMFLSYSVMEVDRGRITLGEVHESLELVPRQPVALDPDQAARWPWMDPNGDFRHLGTSVRFDATARTAAALFEAAGNEPVDGVLAVDALALQALLTVTGPAAVDGEIVSADRIVADLLHDQYLVFGDGSIGDVQAARRDRLGEVAAAAMEAFGSTSDLETDDLDGIGEAAQARHLMAWSGDPDRQAAFEVAGIDGRLPDDGMLLSVVNRGGNKLDWFLPVEATMSVRPDPAGDEVEVRARLLNQVPAGEPTYVTGPYPGSGLRAGEYLGVATLTVPGYATELRSEDSAPIVRGRDGTHQIIGTRVQIEAGGDLEVVFRFRLPPEAKHLEVVPSARALPTEWSFVDPDGEAPQTWADVDQRRVDWAP